MKKFFCFGVLLLMFSAGLFAHEYILDKNPSRSWGFATYTGTTQVTTLTSGDWDFGYYDLTLPAGCHFYYYGWKVTHLRITTKGYIIPGFGSPPADTTISLSNVSMPNTSSPNPTIAVLWDDWDLSGGGTIWYTVASNYVIVEWRGVNKYATGGAYDFSCIICGNGHGNFPDCILFQYIDVVEGIGSTDYGVSSTMGVEHPQGTQGDEYSHNTASVNNGDIYMATPFVPIYGMTDGWSDGYPDSMIFRPNNGVWYCRMNDLAGSTTETYVWGTKNDIAVPGDYDANTYYDVGVYRPNNSIWFTNGAVTDFTVQWGQSGDIPVPGDWDGDGDTDIAVWRPSNGIWYIYYLPAGTAATIRWGQEGDMPVPADYDNDGQMDVAVYRPSNNVWYIRRSSNPALYYSFAWGADGDVPMPANFQSGAYCTACIYRPSTGQWFSYNQTNGSTYTLGPWGIASDVPIPNDWNAGTITDAAVFRPTSGMWYNYGYSAFSWGQIGDKPRIRRSSQIIAPALGNPSLTDGMGRSKK